MPREFSEEAIAASEADAKIGLLATVNPEGLPHLTLITSLQALGPRRLMWGQFCEGLSKRHVKVNPRAAFLFLNQKRELWRGRCEWTGEAKEGAEYELYNRKPMFRYNSYFGIHTVHYMDMVETAGKETLSIPAIARGSVAAYLSRPLAGAGRRRCVLGAWGRALLGRLSTMKFLSFVDSSGFPRIVPAITGNAAGGGGFLFCPAVGSDELESLPPGATVAVYAINLQMESILIRGIFRGYRRPWGPRTGLIDINWVYNSMPPTHGQIYPARPLQAVSFF